MKASKSTTVLPNADLGSMTGRKTIIDGKSSIENEKKNKLAKDKFIEKVAVKEQK